MDLANVARSVTDARTTLTSWGKAVRDLRNDSSAFSQSEIDAIEGEYEEKTKLEQEASAELQKHMNDATRETEALQAKVHTREKFMASHAAILVDKPELWSSMKDETENFRAVIESIRTLLGSA